MSIQLRKEQNDYIDKILSKGLDEIKNVPSFDLNILSNSPNHNSIKINNEEEKKEIFFHSMNYKMFCNNKYYFNIQKNINNKISQKTFNNQEENKENNTNFIPCNIPNNKEIIEKALCNNQKNINKLNKQITGNTLSFSQNDNNKSSISSSTQNLIDKYIDLKSSICSKNDSSFNNNNDIMNIHDLSCINKINDTKNNRYEKYNPKSSALKKLIEKLKKEDEYEESRNKSINDFSNSIQISSFGDSGLFTLGNSNMTSSKEKTKITREKKFKNENRNKYNKSENKKIRIKKVYKSELNSNMLRTKNIRTFDKIMESNKKNEMDLIRDKIKKLSLQLNDINDYSNSKKNLLIKKNYSMKSLQKTNYKMKKLYFPIFSALSMGNLYYMKSNNKKRKSKSMIIINNTKTKKEEKEFIIKYEELKEKFEAQREKMKKEKENVILLRQKIKLFNKKFEKYPELVEFNKTLNDQNFILLNNLNYSDDVRKKQSKLIEVLQNQIKKLKMYK